MAVVPVDSSIPLYSILQWTNPGDAFSLYITERTLDTLQVQITDWQGNPFTSMPDHALTMQLDTFRCIDTQSGARLKILAAAIDFPCSETSSAVLAALCLK
jgi:hypothetical protein